MKLSLRGYMQNDDPPLHGKMMGDGDYFLLEVKAVAPSCHLRGDVYWLRFFLVSLKQVRCAVCSCSCVGTDICWFLFKKGAEVSLKPNYMKK